MNRVQSSDQVVQVGGIEQRILLIRGERVIVDADLAEVYGITTKRLNEQVQRNSGRFPGDFVFTLSAEEKREVVANCDHLRKLRYSRSLPYEFTEHCAIMAASVLNSERAIEMSVFVVRVFVRLRLFLVEQRELARRLEDLERAIGAHDQQIVAIVEAIRGLMSQEAIPRQRRIGFEVGES
jgi:hypothetical protein